jgi:hypothetical protein
LDAARSLSRIKEESDNASGTNGSPDLEASASKSSNIEPLQLNEVTSSLLVLNASSLPYQPSTLPQQSILVDSARSAGSDLSLKDLDLCFSNISMQGKPSVSSFSQGINLNSLYYDR